MQEVFQSNGDTDWRNIIDDIAQDVLGHRFRGSQRGGIWARRSIRESAGSGVDVLDVAGMGGTRFADIEIALNPEIHEPYLRIAYSMAGDTPRARFEYDQNALPETACWHLGASGMV